MSHRLQAVSAGRRSCRQPDLLAVSAIIAAMLLPMQPGRALAEDGLPNFSDFELRLGQDKLNREAAEAQLALARAALYPNVAIGSDVVLAGRIDYSPDITRLSPDSYAKRDPSSAGVQVSWKLFDGLRNLNNIAAANENVLYTFQASLDTRQKLLLDQAEKTLIVIRDRALLSAYDASVRRYSQSVDIAAKMLNDEMMTVSQVALARSELEGARALATQAAGTLKSSELDYRKLTGNWPPAKLALAPPEGKLPDTSSTAALRAQGNSPLLKAAVHLEKEADYKAQSAEGLRGPTVDLVGRYTRTFDPLPSVDNLDNYAVLLQVRVPIFDPTIQPTIALAKVDAAQRRYDRQDATLAVSVEAKRQFDLFISLTVQMASLRRQVTQAEITATATRKEMEAGVRTVSDLLEAERGLLAANISLGQVRYARSLSVFRLLATTGELDRKDVGLGGDTF